MKRVLIADDDAKTREVLAINLASWGFDVVVAASGIEAWTIMQRQDAPKIALFDSNVTGIDHLELCRRAREKDGDNSFLLVLTPSDAKPRHLDALEAGADGAVGKPLDLRELRMTLAAGLRGRRLASSAPPSRRSLSSISPAPPTTPGDHALAGSVIEGKYRVNRLIGRGGMGTVWQGTHLTLGISVAIKFIKAEYARHPLARSRFELEARTAARLQTKYAVKTYDYGVTEDGQPYLVMEYLEGPSLLQAVQKSGPLSFAETSTIVTQAAHALGQLHACGTIHRDVKPDNVLLIADPDEDGARKRLAKVIDFGVAKVLVESMKDGSGGPITQGGMVIGTPNYMPPEQLTGEGRPSVDSDLWALATCAFTALTGRIPFEGTSFSKIVRRVCSEPLPIPSYLNPSVPPEFDAWFARACSRDVKDRFRSARALARALVDAHANYTKSILELTPSIKSFVGGEDPKGRSSLAPASSLLPTQRPSVGRDGPEGRSSLAPAYSLLPTQRPFREGMYELDVPTLDYR
jgi:serine/threonine-protein kinase